jgi:hypothetical protein
VKVPAVAIRKAKASAAKALAVRRKAKASVVKALAVRRKAKDLAVRKTAKASAVKVLAARRTKVNLAVAKADKEARACRGLFYSRELARIRRFVLAHAMVDSGLWLDQ